MSSKFGPGCRLGRGTWRRYVHDMCGRVRLSSDVSEIKLAFSIPPERPAPNFAASWNVAPTDPLPVGIATRNDVRSDVQSSAISDARSLRL